MALSALLAAVVYSRSHPLAELGWLAWPIAFSVHLWLLRRHEAAGTDWLDYLHASSVWVLAAVGAWEVGWAIDRLVAGAQSGVLEGVYQVANMDEEAKVAAMEYLRLEGGWLRFVRSGD